MIIPYDSIIKTKPTEFFLFIDIENLTLRIKNAEII